MTSAHIINEPPLLVLPSLAKKIGINHAILLQQMHYWLRTSKHKKGGHTWVYNTYEEWQEQLPWLSTRGIRKLISDLERDGYIVVANHNRAKFDQTKWYRIDYSRLNRDFSDVSQSVTSSDTECQTMWHEVSDEVTQNDTSDVAQSVTPIPETTETTSEIAPSGALRIIEGDAPKKPAVKGDTPAHHLVNAWYDLVGGAPTNHGKDLGHAKTLLNAGLTKESLPAFIPWLRKSYWGQDGIDLGAAVKGVNRWISTQSAPAQKRRFVV